MIVGALGPVVFSVSSELVRTIQAGSRERGTVFHQHTPIGRPPKLEAGDPELDQIQLDILLDQNLGTSPAIELAELNALKNLQRPLPLILGPIPIGEFVITRIKEEWRRHSSVGVVNSVMVRLDLLEDADGPLTTRINNAI